MRVLLADDQEAVRLGMRQLVESHDDWKVCAEVDNGQAADAIRRYRHALAVDG